MDLSLQNHSYAEAPRVFWEIFISAPASALVPGIPSSVENSMSLRAQPYLYSAKSTRDAGSPLVGFLLATGRDWQQPKKGESWPLEIPPWPMEPPIKTYSMPLPLHSPVPAHCLVLTSLQVHFKLASLCKPKCRVLGVSQHSLSVHSSQTAIEHFLQNVDP